MQARISNICYLINEFSFIEQRMLGWIHRRLRKASALKNESFEGCSVILLVDFAELPPVLDKPLYHYVPDNATSLTGYMAYKI